MHFILEQASSLTYNVFLCLGEVQDPEEVKTLWQKQISELREEIKIDPTQEIELFPLVAAGANLKNLWDSLEQEKKKNIRSIKHLLEYFTVAFVIPPLTYPSAYKALGNHNSEQTFLPIIQFRVIQQEKGLEEYLTEKLQSMNKATARLYAQFLEDRIPEESKLGQERIATLIRLANLNDEKSPYTIYNKLLKKRNAVINLKELEMPVIDVFLDNSMWSTPLQINPLFAGQNFQKRILNKNLLPHNFGEFLGTFNTLLDPLREWIQEKNLDKNGSAYQLCQKYLTLDPKVEEIPLETFYMAAIMSHVTTLSDKPMENHDRKLSPKEDFLGHLMLQMQGCPKGLKGGIEDVYYHLPVEKQLIGNTNKDVLNELLHQCVREYVTDGTNRFYKAVCGLSRDADVKEAVHEAT